MRIVVEVHILSYLLYDIVYIIYSGHAFLWEPTYTVFSSYITEGLSLHQTEVRARITFQETF